MDWIFYAFLGAALLHLAEEFVYPGGFLAFMKRMVPPFAPLISTNFAVAINGAFLLLCMLGVWTGQRAPVFGLSIASLCGLNGLLHVFVTLRTRSYAPGLITGGLLYVPLAILAYALFLRSGRLSPWQGLASAMLGLAYQAVPLIYLGFASVTKRSG